MMSLQYLPELTAMNLIQALKNDPRQVELTIWLVVIYSKILEDYFFMTHIKSQITTPPKMMIIPCMLVTKVSLSVLG